MLNNTVYIFNLILTFSQKII